MAADFAATLAAGMAAGATTPQAAASPKVAAPPTQEATPKPVSKAPAAPAEPKAAVATAQETQAAQKEKWKLKADGEEFEWDPSDVEATKREIMKARGANKRFEEAAAQRKQAETFFEMLKDPNTLKQVLTDPRVGIDLKKFAEEFVWQQMQEEALTPEQRKQRDIETELKKYRDQETKTKNEHEAKQQKDLQEHYEVDFEKRIMSALQSGGVPNTKGAVRRMAFYLQQSIANNLDLQPSDLVVQVRKDLQEEHREMYSTADASVLIDLVGEELAKKIRQADVKRLKTTQPEQHRKPSPSQRKPTDRGVKKLSGEEWKEALQKKLLGS